MATLVVSDLFWDVTYELDDKDACLQAIADGLNAGFDALAFHVDGEEIDRKDLPAPSGISTEALVEMLLQAEVVEDDDDWSF